MALAYLLDTNVLSDLVRNPRGRVAARIAEVGESAVCTSVVVAAELRYGAARAGSARLAERVALVLAALDVLPLEAPADVHYGDIRSQLAARGTPIGPNDLFIAAHARALGLTVVTANRGEFERVPGLAIDDWLGA
ncbi:MAG: type II toxin-antitoxin system VapC family toxin [Gammaproteobacteria bacterium]|nr:type II toxin-antitoxin system VapC family toxin [Gammaproteobacteria bacterium]MCP5201070.1 type II toxin-antitoxin system VapC family toxin [Gammaproteobacteria bacterium]